MRVSVERWPDCRPDLGLLWLEMRRDNPDLASPYFHPKFTGIINEASPQSVEIAVLHERHGVTAMLPFQRLEKGIGVPVGHFLSDYHGLICRPGFRCDLREVIKACRLSIFDFDHAPTLQTSFSPFTRTVEPSPQIDLSAGADSYLMTNKAVKSDRIKIRRIERDLGPLRLVAHSTDEIAWMQFCSWKSQQFERTNVRDIFVIPWVQAVLREVHATQDRDFSGMFTLLYAGPHLVAAHFGMRSGPLLHSWFPTYDPALSAYSPGVLLWIKLIEAAAGLRITKIDFGKGMHQGKRRFMNSSCEVASGSVELPSATSLRRTARRQIGRLARAIGLRPRQPELRRSS